MPPKKCPSKKITRRSHTRTLSKSGKKVYVKRTCVPDKGKPGKTLKRNRVLPKVNRKISLRRFGYSLKKTDKTRHASLVKASNELNPLKVLGRLNLIRNYTPESKNKIKLNKDVEFMSGVYSKHKADDGRRKNSRAKKALNLRRASLRKQMKKQGSNRKSSKRTKSRKNSKKSRTNRNKK